MTADFVKKLAIVPVLVYCDWINFGGFDMGWTRNILGATFVVGALGALYIGDKDNPDAAFDEVSAYGELALGGGFRAVEGGVKSLGKQGLRLLENNGLDVEDYKDENGYVDIPGLVEALQERGVTIDGFGGSVDCREESSPFASSECDPP